ncbi:MAG: hypothetical protein K1000chlam2_00759 [Chlamydiae bacterium]|nr:hypothetical protein [Chlamydiota bacterium]
MKAWLSLLFFVASIAYFNPTHANFQSDSQPTGKHYVPFEKLHFGENGIFLKTDSDSWLAIEQLQHDSEGYFLAGFWDSIFKRNHYIATCNSCGHEYHNEGPQPCRYCDKSYGFDIVTEDDYWDRHG